jgi:predicted hydrocarbon binding protein
MGQLEIRHKAAPDPVAEIPIVDAYMRWALLAAEEVVGQQGLTSLLNQIGLARLVDDNPPNTLTATGSFTFADYANLSAGLLTSYGRAGKSMTLRIGRLSVQYAIEQQAQVFGTVALATSKILPISLQLRLGMEAIHAGYRALMPEMKMRIEDRGEWWAYIDETCPVCAGRDANSCMCWAGVGMLQEAAHWQTGKDFEIEEVECRAFGGRACVYEISKKPKE